MRVHPHARIRHKRNSYERDLSTISTAFTKKEKSRQKRKKNYDDYDCPLSLFPIPLLKVTEQDGVQDLFCNLKSGQLGTQKRTGAVKSLTTVERFERSARQGAGVFPREGPRLMWSARDHRGKKECFSPSNRLRSFVDGTLLQSLGNRNLF